MRPSPGENLEETLRREVAEEVGLEVESIQYSGSQHWPFPQSSFMVACHAFVNPDKTQVSRRDCVKCSHSNMTSKVTC